ncbi:glycerol-3-phosphate dehydrogenase C-terminal domain-containing protein, partial [Staphylococcus arlettae]
PLDIYTELIYSIQNEMVYRPTDFFIRRTGKLYFKIDDVLNYKEQVIDVMSELLGYSDVQKELYKQELETAINEAQTGNNQPAVKE